MISNLNQGTFWDSWALSLLNLIIRELHFVLLIENVFTSTIVVIIFFGKSNILLAGFDMIFLL